VVKPTLQYIIYMWTSCTCYSYEVVFVIVAIWTWQVYFRRGLHASWGVYFSRAGKTALSTLCYVICLVLCDNWGGSLTYWLGNYM